MSDALSWQKYDPAWGAGPIPPVPDESLVDMFKSTVEKNTDKAAVIFLDRETSYGELDRLSNRLAAFLIEAGIRKGDRVATMLPNCLQHVVAFYAILKAGAVIVPFNVMLKSDEAAYILKDSGAKVLIALDLVYPLVKPEVEKLNLNRVVTVHVKDFAAPGAEIPPLLSGAKTPQDGAADFMDAIDGRDGDIPPVNFQPRDDLAMLLYTSGTTGFPKGAMVSHYNFYASTVQLSAITGLEADDVFFMLFPQFHIAGYILNLVPSVYLGATVLPVPMFDPVQAMKQMQRHNVSLFFAPPTGYIGLLSHPEFPNYDLSGIRLTVACGAPVPPALQKAWREKVGTYLYNGYGATETTGVAPGILEMPNRKKFAGETLGSVMGELKIVDLDGNVVPRGTVGEMMLKGEGVVRGYWNKPDKTSEEFTEDGWWHSGDAAYMDDEGWVYFVERIKDLIIASGYNIAPVEVENYIYKHPSVQEVSVVGVMDEYRGETVKAVIVLKADYAGKVTEDEIIQFCREKMAVYKAPKIVEFVNELPKTATGKILRRILREQHVSQKK